MIKPACLTAVLMGITLLTSTTLAQDQIVKKDGFFKSPPKAERAILSAYRSSEYQGQFSIVIETQQLNFLDPDSKPQLEPEIHLEHIALPSIDPATWIGN